MIGVVLVVDLVEEGEAGDVVVKAASASFCSSFLHGLLLVAVATSLLPREKTHDTASTGWAAPVLLALLVGDCCLLLVV